MAQTYYKTRCIMFFFVLFLKEQVTAADVVIWATLYPVLQGKYVIKGEKPASLLDNNFLYRVC